MSFVKVDLWPLSALSRNGNLYRSPTAMPIHLSTHTGESATRRGPGHVSRLTFEADLGLRRKRRLTRASQSLSRGTLRPKTAGKGKWLFSHRPAQRLLHADRQSQLVPRRRIEEAGDANTRPALSCSRALRCVEIAVAVYD